MLQLFWPCIFFNSNSFNSKKNFQLYYFSYPVFYKKKKLVCGNRSNCNSLTVQPVFHRLKYIYEMNSTFQKPDQHLIMPLVILPDRLPKLYKQAKWLTIRRMGHRKKATVQFQTLYILSMRGFTGRVCIAVTVQDSNAD